MTPERRPPSGPGHGEHPRVQRRTMIPVRCQLEGGPVEVTTLVVSTRGGRIVLDPQVAGSCVMSLDEEEAMILGNLLSVWLG